MNRYKLFTLSIIVMLLVGATSTIQAQDSNEEICVTISGNEVCGSPATIAQILELTNTDGGNENESEFFTTTAPHSGNININVPTMGVEPFKLAQAPNQPSMLVGAHHSVAEPGGRTTENCREADRDVSALCSIRSNVQKTFTTDGPEYWLIPEGSDMGPGHVVLTGAVMTIELPNGQVIDLTRGEEDHSYVVILSGTDGDGTTPGDRNQRIKVTNFDPGSTMVTSIPPSEFVSLDYVHQNVDAAFGNECGNDGCNYVTLVTVDSLGAVSVITFSIGEAELVASNWYELEAEDD
jgi:hypothetical protein